MSFLRKILYPLSVLYGEVTSARNKMYDKGMLKSTSFDTPTIVVGNLSVGGTGKSPQIEYLIRLLKNTYKVAVLSRGYKRTSKGFIVADHNASAESIGDEPMQFHTKFNEVTVAVDADRVNGITQLKKLYNPEVILLDDAYQHRKVEGGFNILLTPYDNLYVDDTMLPTGELREKVNGASRAQIIIVTKCPETLSEEEQYTITCKLKPELYQTVFFSKIAYNDAVISKKDEIAIDNLKDYKVLLVTGIAKTKPLTDFLAKQSVVIEHLKFKDHYHFSDKDYNTIFSSFANLKGDKKLILTTEKDYVRAFANRSEIVYYLPIKTSFIEHQDSFDTLVKKYVSSSI